MAVNLENKIDRFERVAIVTGANSGLGYEAALAMSQRGLRVVLACRSPEKAETARRSILEVVPQGKLELLPLDLKKMASVRSAAAEFRRRHDRLDVLVNNAGIMYPPYAKTEDGFESQMASNCFGHFLLTALLIDLFPDTPASRITWLSSSAHKSGKINLDDINSERRYSKVASYGQSKLACLMYALELDRRLKNAGKQIRSNSAHPGGVISGLSRNMSQTALQLMKYTILPFVTQPAAAGVLPILEAALAPSAEGGRYYGPQGFLEMKGPSGRATIAKQALDRDVSEKLWQLSERLTGANYHGMT